MYSLILPFHSDHSRLSSTIDLIEKNKTAQKITEIILSHNGDLPDQKTWNEILSLQREDVRVLHTDKKGLGAGYRLGIENACSEFVVLSASDLPFGFSDIEALQGINDVELAIGSKAHKKSKIDGYSLKRKVASLGFWLFRAYFLGAETPKDSQGSIIVRTDLAKKIAPMCLSDDYFFSVEFITLAQKQGVKVIELPVVLENHDGQSSVSVLKDSFRMATALAKFSKRLQERGK